MRLHEVLFLAGMGGGRDHDRAAARHRHQPLQFCGIGGRRRHVELEVAGGNDIAAAEGCKALGIELGLRQTHVEAAEQRCDGAAHPLPARKRAL